MIFATMTTIMTNPATGIVTKTITETEISTPEAVVLSIFAVVAAVTLIAFVRRP